MLYRIAEPADWQFAQQTGFFISADLAAEGFIHSSEQYQILETALDKVHTDLKSDTDVLLPTAYLPSTPGSTPSPKEGVWVDSEKYPGKEARITLIPNPVRIMLTVGKQVQQELWKA